MNESRFGYKHTIAACSIAYVVQAVVNNFVPLLFLTFRKEFGFSLGAISGLIAINFGIQLLVDFLSAKVIDKIGYRNTMVTGHMFAVVGFLALAFLPDFLPVPYAGVVISVIFYAIGGGIMEVLVSPVVEACPTENKAGTMSFLHSFYCWGHVLVIVLSTLFFVIAGIENWRIMAVLWAVIPVLNAIFFLLVPINTPVEEGQGMKITELVKSPVFLVLFLLMFCSGASEQSMSQWASAFAEDALGVSKTIGDLTGPCLFAVCMGASRVLYSWFSGKFKLQRTMIYSLALGITSYLLAIVSGNAVISLVGCALVGFSVGILWPGTFSLASSKLPLGGTAMFALLALAGDLGCGAGPALVGIVSGLANDNIKKGLFIALLFPIAMITTIMIVNKNLTMKLLKEKKTWIGIGCAALVVTLSAFAGGCGNNDKNNVPTPTPTPIAVTPYATATPAPTATLTPTPTPEAEAATPTPTRKPTASPTPTPTGKPSEFKDVTITDYSAKVFVTADSLRVRKGPGTTYEVIGGTKYGEKLTVTGDCSNNWWRISLDGITGYVSKDYTTFDTITVTQAPATPTPRPTSAPGTGTNPTPSANFANYVNFDGAAYIAIDAKTGKTLHAYNENAALSPASLTKMMTALVAVEQYNLTDEIPTDYAVLHWNDISYNGKTVKGDDNEMTTLASLLGNRYTAEQWMTASYTVEERLYQMLLESAADSAEALAMYGEGSIDFFMYMCVADKINELGLSNKTDFNNPVGADSTCGIEYAGNVSTAADLAKIAKALMEDSTLREIVGTKKYSISSSGRIAAMTLKNSHPLYDSAYATTLYDVIGIKTGYTTEAGYNLATCGKKGTREIIVITLGNKSREDSAVQTKKILDYIFTYEN